MRWYRAPAKVNLTLRVSGRRVDGFHDIESLVAFADPSDWLGFTPGPRFGLTVKVTGTQDVGPLEQNLVARAARALAANVSGLQLGEFHLIKRLPAAAGLGGGSSDAAACLRALADANGLALLDERVQTAALETGADVPVCISARARMMTGVGDCLGPLVRLPSLFAVLVNPRQSLSTKEVFEALGVEPGAVRYSQSAPPETSSSAVTLEALEAGANDLESAARKVLPLVADIVDGLKRLPGARIARMSGSGATCFALFEGLMAARNAHSRLTSQYPSWWITTTTFR
jgi:4-diphosphocytidyl-2-C-methyl-D-erythritol kinase